jgi:hypothetical protein
LRLKALPFWKAPGAKDGSAGWLESHFDARDAKAFLRVIDGRGIVFIGGEVQYATCARRI